jgi:hypothetical protein
MSQAMITIHNLEVQFDVEGNEDRQQFVHLFNECIQRWSEEAEEAKLRETQAAKERSLGHRPSDGM